MDVITQSHIIMTKRYSPWVQTSGQISEALGFKQSAISHTSTEALGHSIALLLISETSIAKQLVCHFLIFVNIKCDELKTWKIIIFTEGL